MTSNLDSKRTSGSKEPQDQPGAFRAVGIPIGVAIGVALGVALDNIPVGIAIGAAIGIAFGSAMGRSRQGLAWDSADRQKRRLLLVVGLGVLGLLVGAAALVFLGLK